MNKKYTTTRAKTKAHLLRDFLADGEHIEAIPSRRRLRPNPSRGGRHRRVLGGRGCHAQPAVPILSGRGFAASATARRGSGGADGISQESRVDGGLGVPAGV